MRAFHARIRAALLSLANIRHLAWRDRTGSLGAAYVGLYAYGRDLLKGDRYRKGVAAAAAATAVSVNRQIGDAIGRDVSVDLGSQELALSEYISASVASRMDMSLDKADSTFAEWEASGTEIGALEESLSGAFEVSELGTLASVALAFGSAWADMNEETQTAEGIEHYVWIAQRDAFTRPAHAALDNTVDDWDDPPLKADVSSNGEDCHPGDDYNCRCIAGPIPQ